MWILSVLSITCALIGLWQIRTGTIPFIEYKWWALANGYNYLPTAYLGQHTLLGPFLVVGMACCLFLGRPALAAINGIVILQCDSSFTYLSMGVVLFIWIAYRFSPYISVSLGALAAAYMLIAPGGYMTDHGRIPAWKQTYKQIEQAPALGYGGGSFRHLFEQPPAHQAMHGTYKQAHNEFLQVTFEYGVVGLLVLLYMIMCFYGKAILMGAESEYICMAAIVTALLVNSIGNFPFHIVPTGIAGLWAFYYVTKEDVSYG